MIKMKKPTSGLTAMRAIQKQQPKTRFERFKEKLGLKQPALSKKPITDPNYTIVDTIAKKSIKSKKILEVVTNKNMPLERKTQTIRDHLLKVAEKDPIKAKSLLMDEIVNLQKNYAKEVEALKRYTKDKKKFSILEEELQAHYTYLILILKGIKFQYPKLKAHQI